MPGFDYTCQRHPIQRLYAIQLLILVKYYIFFLFSFARKIRYVYIEIYSLCCSKYQISVLSVGIV